MIPPRRPTALSRKQQEATLPSITAALQRPDVQKALADCLDAETPAEAGLAHDRLEALIRATAVEFAGFFGVHLRSTLAKVVAYSLLVEEGYSPAAALATSGADQLWSERLTPDNPITIDSHGYAKIPPGRLPDRYQRELRDYWRSMGAARRPGPKAGEKHEPTSRSIDPSKAARAFQMKQDGAHWTDIAADPEVAIEYRHYERKSVDAARRKVARYIECGALNKTSSLRRTE